MNKGKIKVGDRIKVVRKHYGFEPYEIGDEFVVSDIDEIGEFPEGALLSVEGYPSEYMMFESEAEKVEADLFERIDDLFKPSIVAVNSPLSKVVQQSIDIASSFPPSVGFGEGEQAPADAVNSPSHYTQGGVEVIDIIAQTVSGYDDGFTAHCVGTATKYLNRAPHKHATPLEDLEKAAKYLEFAIAHEKKKRN